MPHHAKPTVARSIQGGRAWLLVIVGGLFLLLALYFTYAAAWSSVKQHQAGRFVPVTAEVLTSAVRTQVSSGKPPRQTPQAYVHYRYTVGSQVFESTRIYFLGPGQRGYDDVRALVDRFPAGAMVTAYHDPGNPSVSVLDNTGRPPSTPMVLLMLTFVAGSLLVMRHGWKRGS